ncbi:hypothetical protein N656DRAFT_18342 [Canariomyces notabilis]|uniref:Uncharacterized protein n=1 Tax=Canariomyces notabilis TaxID=2074819 RepID=A0AAN6YXI1_9PEZI|nr:hypothetical protein N656DRAFT_18342 [Canariomyces arenarius]
MKMVAVQRARTGPTSSQRISTPRCTQPSNSALQPREQDLVTAHLASTRPMARQALGNQVELTEALGLFTAALLVFFLSFSLFSASSS